MFSNLYSAALLVLPALAVATPAPILARGGGGPGPVTNSCNTGNVTCCNQLQSASDSGLTSVLGLLGVPISNLQGLVGVGCTPVSVFGGGLGSSCTANPVCCKNDAIGGLIGLGCIPVQLSA